jgi:hypothetical protein
MSIKGKFQKGWKERSKNIAECEKSEKKKKKKKKKEEEEEEEEEGRRKR